jgi:glycosyltransferase involved in cell wall biosynthesis
MISVVMPYWQRQAILSNSLATYRSLYSGEDIEIIIVDDGSPEPAEVKGEFPWPVKVIRLAAKRIALNPCIPFNLGVAASSGEFVVLTNPEVIHRGTILDAMARELTSIGPRGYVAAACWGVQAEWWYCHSSLMPSVETVHRAKMPEGAGLHFCSMLHRKFYDEIDGFCEEYRNGRGYEDNDLLWKLDAAGAIYKIADHLVTDHQDCPRSQWPAGGGERNRAIFDNRWPQ